MSEEVRASIQGPVRRLIAMGLLLAAAGVFGFMTLRLPWYQFDFNGTINIPGSFETVEGVSVSKTITGFELSKLEFGDATGYTPLTVGIGGFILPAVWLAAGAALGTAAAFLRNGFISLVSLVALYLSYSGLGGVRTAMEDPTYGGQYNTLLGGMSQFTLMIFLCIGLSLMVGMQIILVNRREKKARRESGEEISPSLIETIGALKLSNLVNVASSVAEEAKSAKDSAKVKAAAK